MRLAGTLFLGFLCFLAVGCEKRPPAPAAANNTTPQPEPVAPVARPNRPASEWTANEILQQLLTTYRHAKTYQDQGVVRLSFRQGGQPVSQELPAAVAFERPSKISVVAYQATVKCDGRELRAKIDDPATNNVDGQVVVRPAPADIKLADLASDPLLYDILSSRLRRQPIQLELLLKSAGLVSAFNADVACKRLEDQQHSGTACFRVEVPSPGGAFVFWVDQAEGLLRRLDYPAAALVPDLASDPSVTDLTLLADLRQARINGMIDAGQFVLDIPASAKRVRSFVIPLRPLPSTLFGEKPQEFFFTTLDGGKLADSDLNGKISILTWYHDNPACEATLQQVSAAKQRLKENDAVAFYAVATDPTSRTADALQQRLNEWKVELPIVRDLEAFGDKSFHIDVQPTMVVLDKAGRVQVFQPGGSPELADQIVQIVERLARGDDLAAQIVEQHARERQEYEKLIASGGLEPGKVPDEPEAVIRRRSEPKKFSLRPLWTSTELKAPGNILLTSDDDAASVLVIEGWRSVANIGPDGKVAGRHTLAIPEGAAITFLRAAKDREGRQHYVASAPLAPQFFAFDDAWQAKLTFPPPGNAPLQVIDLALTALDPESGTPDVLVSSVGDVGVVAVSLQGETKWRNRKFPNALSVAITQPDEFGARRLLVTGESGAVLPLNRYGNDDPPVAVPNWSIGRLIAGSFPGQSQAGLLALAADAKGQPFAVGLTDKLKELWNYPLPAGVHQRPIEAVTQSHVLPGHDGEWWIAGPDGSIHLITADGKRFDSFFYGAALSGIAAGRLDGKPTLLIASDSGLAAFEVQVAEALPRSRER
jgi:hypothetical protein